MEFSGEILSIIALASIIIGVVYCFFGYRIFKVVLAILGFILGISIFGAIAFNISGGEQGIAIIAGLVGGLIGSVLIVDLYFIGIFLLGAGLGSLIGILFTTGSGTNPELIILLISAVIGGTVAVILQESMIIVSTSLGGSWSIVSGIFHFVGWDFDPIQLFHDPMSMRYMGTQFNIMLLCWIPLGIAGILVQYKITEGKNWKKKSYQKS